MNVRRRWGTANGRPLLRPHINCLSAEEREMQAGGATHRNHWCAGVAVCSQRSLVAVQGGACGLVDAIRSHRCRARTCMCSSAVCYTCFAMFRRHGIGQKGVGDPLKSRYMRKCLGLAVRGSALHAPYVSAGVLSLGGLEVKEAPAVVSSSRATAQCFSDSRCCSGCFDSVLHRARCAR
jgi:hypothetical protein